MNQNYHTFRLTEDNSKGFGVLGGYTAAANIDENISSNLAFDKYQGLLAYGTRSGDIKMVSMKGYEQEIYGAHDGCAILHMLFVPGQLLLFSIDAKNRLVCRDLRSSGWQPSEGGEANLRSADNVKTAASYNQKKLRGQ